MTFKNSFDRAMTNVNTSCSLSVIIVLLLEGVLSQACIFGPTDQNCTYTCNCPPDGNCDAVSGACDGGCRQGAPRPPGNEGVFDWRGPGCRIGNVALNKPVNQSGVAGWPASNSVDGRLPSWLPDTQDLEYCAHTDPAAAEFAWWYVDLGGNFYINNISIFNRKEPASSRRTGYLDIRVGNSSNIASNTLCVSYVGPVPPEKSVTLTCDFNLIGRYVSLHRTGGNQSNIINICEVVVMGFEYVTANSTNCLSDSDNVVGCLNCSGFEPPLCITPCSRGQYGINCNASCSTHRCLNGSDTCDGWTGECPDGCQMWYTFNSCSKEIKVVDLGEETNLTVINISTNEVTLRWRSAGDISPDLDQNYGYLVQYQMQNATEFILGTNITHDADKAEHSATVSGLEFNTLYEFQVSAYRLWQGLTNVSTMPSNMATVTTLCKAPELATNVNVTPRTNTSPFSFHVQWQLTSSGCDSISSIQVLYRLVDTDTLMTYNVSDPAGSSSANVTDIAESGGLDVRIRVVNNAHLVSESATHSVTLGGTTTTPYVGISTATSVSPLVENPTGGDLNIGLIMGPVAGGLLLIVIVVVIVVVCVRRRKPQKPKDYGVDNLQMSNRLSDGSFDKPVGVVGPTRKPDIVAKPNMAQVSRGAPGNSPLPMVTQRDPSHHVAVSEATAQVTSLQHDLSSPYANTEPVSNAPIVLSRLKLHISQLSQPEPRANAVKTKDGKRYITDGFEREFDDLPGPDLKQRTVGKTQANLIKNRFKNIQPYDDNRVVLEAVDELQVSDYVNASYIMGYPKKTNHYIAAQGPTKETVLAFWFMIWQKQANRIVMLTRLNEGGKTKCERYWPDDDEADEDVQTYGPFTVSLMVSETHADYAYRKLRLNYKGESRDVHHLHFIAWDDKKCPEDNFPLLAFRGRVLRLPCEATGPLVVHCSAGVGRTGTFIALDYLINQAKCEGGIDVFECVYRLRTQRMYMVQTEVQYKFLYHATLEGVETKMGETGIPQAQFVAHYATMCQDTTYSNQSPLQEEFQMLCKYKPPANPSPICTENKAKNRCQDVLPADRRRPRLSTPHSGSDDYINAVFADSFGKHKSTILTQMPLPNTVVDFWRLIYDHECNCIVMLNEMETADMTDTQYWPSEDLSKTNFGPIHVQHISTEQGSNVRITSKTFKVYNERRREEPRTVRQYQLSGWDMRDKVPPHADLFIDLIQNVTYWRRNQKGGSTVVHCRDGAERSGLFAAGSYLLDLMQAEQEVDVMLAARYITSRRPETISTQEQYHFLFEMAKSYISGFHTYGNA